MTKDKKQLLLVDLCARLPYGVMVQPRTAASPHKLTGYDKGYLRIDTDQRYRLESIKPYLRPLSSMTEEEKEELSHYDNAIQRADFFYSHHIDCRGLIPLGLALTAHEDMYTTT